MERISDKHSPRVDDELKHELLPLTQGAPVGSRADEARELEGPGGGEPAASAHVLQLAVTGPAAVASRRELVRHLHASWFPCDRTTLLEGASREDAPDEILALLEALPEGRRFRTMYEVWGALGGDTDDVPSEVAHREGRVHRQDS